jgi:hypothetical protein
MVAYTRAGATQMRQRFTDDRELAAKSLRIVSSTAALAPRSPYDGVQEVLNRFDAVPAGRRAILLFSDGVDTTGGLSLASITQSFELDQTIKKAQRKSVAVYSIYSPTIFTRNANSTLVNAGQSGLQKLSDETGGRSFYQGSIAPVSFIPFLRDFDILLGRQFALTYLSTHMKRGYHRLDVMSTNPEVKIEHPKGYYYR